METLFQILLEVVAQVTCDILASIVINRKEKKQEDSFPYDYPATPEA
jgi:hypothetical protein